MKWRHATTSSKVQLSRWKMAYGNEVYTTFSFLGFVMCLIPLPCHLRAWNAGICLYIFWTGTSCLVYCINSIAWNRDLANSAPIWCEICTRFLVASSFGVPAASLCINRRLYLIQRAAGENRASFNKSGRAIIADLTIGLGLPLLSLPIYYISQGHRFNIFEGVGCDKFIYNTWVAVITIFLPPLVICCVSAAYAIRSIVAINKMRAEFRQLVTRHSNMTDTLFFRLMALAGAEVLAAIPITGTFVIINATTNRSPWISWEDTHSNFDRVDQFPAALWRQAPGIQWQLEFARWLYVGCAILFFFFFGSAEEVRRFYGPTLQYAFNVIGIRCGRSRRRDGIAVFKHSPSTFKTNHSEDKIQSPAKTFDATSTFGDV